MPPPCAQAPAQAQSQALGQASSPAGKPPSRKRPRETEPTQQPASKRLSPGFSLLPVPGTVETACPCSSEALAVISERVEPLELTIHQVAALQRIAGGQLGAGAQCGLSALRCVHSS